MSNHPEDFCQKCGGPNIIWFAPNELWNKHARDNGYNILCPICFVQLVEWSEGKLTAWEVSPDTQKEELSTLKAEAADFGAKLERERANKMEAERDTLKARCEKLEGYARHKPSCGATASSLYPRVCDCGLDELRKQG